MNVKLLLGMEGLLIDTPALDGTTALAIALGHMHIKMVHALFNRPLLQLTESSISVAEEVLRDPERLNRFETSGRPEVQANYEHSQKR